MYLRTVRGETRKPSFSSNSLAIRSSPHSEFSVAIRRISWRSSRGIGGRPDLDLERQSRRHPARCQRINVSGRTTTRASRQSKSRESNARDTRVASSTGNPAAIALEDTIVPCRKSVPWLRGMVSFESGEGLGIRQPRACDVDNAPLPTFRPEDAVLLRRIQERIGGRVRSDG